MPSGRRGILISLGIATLVMILGTTPTRAQMGLAVTGVGPINRSMGGAAVAAPLDASGALYWNPATITALPQSELEVGAEILNPRTTLSSRVPAGAFGSLPPIVPGIPPVNLYGRTGGNNGVFALPSIGLVYQPEKSSWTFGFGLFGIGGFGVNYPASGTNPILTPQPVAGATSQFSRGVGPLYTQYQVLQLTPTAAVRLTDELSVGLAPTLDLGSLSADPGVFARPTPFPAPAPIPPQAIPPGLNYPAATNGRQRLGGGFQAGIFYAPGSGWNFGASVKSTQWFDTYTFNSVSATGQPTTAKFHLDFPLIASLGTSYTGFDRWLLAADIRFVDYRHTDGFRRTGFDPEGALRGLGWQSIFALSLGAQYQWTDALALRAGYTFNQNPIGDSVTSYNIAAPTIIQHTLALGGSYDITKALKISFAYAHLFQNAIQGPIISPLGPVAGSLVRSASTGDTFLLGATVKF